MVAVGKPEEHGPWSRGPLQAPMLRVIGVPEVRDQLTPRLPFSSGKASAGQAGLKIPRLTRLSVARVDKDVRD